MTRLAVRGIPTGCAERLRRGGPDANGQPALRRHAQGTMNPCRHCLQLIREGDETLVLSWRPFDDLQPYAEAGPIFLHAGDCPRYASDRLPSWFAHLQPALLRGYGADDWIRYDTGQVLPGTELDPACRTLLQDSDVAYVHVRSKFNCFLCRVVRASPGE